MFRQRSDPSNFTGSFFLGAEKSMADCTFKISLATARANSDSSSPSSMVTLESSSYDQIVFSISV
jgi:hypothetical protein